LLANRLVRNTVLSGGSDSSCGTLTDRQAEARNQHHLTARLVFGNEGLEQTEGRGQHHFGGLSCVRLEFA